MRWKKEAAGIEPVNRPKIILLLFLIFVNSILFGQSLRVEPPNWWVGMKDSTVQLLVHYPGIQSYGAQLEDDHARLVEVHTGTSPNYLFLDVVLPSNMPPKDILLKFVSADGSMFSHNYPVRARETNPDSLQGFDSSDVVYLITPDRFANGDLTNDSNPGLLETGIDRSDDYARHGGDIAGITANLDYIAEMGFTAIWSSPLLINDMPEQSYHGYAITDYYQVDPRFGSLEAYKHLAHKSREKGIKLIMDQVANHCGREHWWMSDLPYPDWINDQQSFENDLPVEQTNHRRTTNQDIYAANADKESMRRGWFVSAMPDLNQQNPIMARYIIQNSIWWIETLQLGGIRQDTYPYPDKDFMADWARSIMTEYPNFTIVGEEWSYNPLLVAYWQDGTANADGYRSYLRSTMDFPLQSALIQALNESENWNTGWIKLYEALANDFAYTDPSSIMLFADNHDMDRVFTQLGEDVVRTKMALSFLLVAPRIPQIYYGTEVLISNSSRPGSHGRIRTDFPGGWPDDAQNAFTGEGLTKEQSEMQNWLRKLLRFRNNSEVLHEGETRHFSPQEGVYVLFRTKGDEQLMLILNKNQQPYRLSLDRFEEMDLKGRHATDLFTGNKIELQEALSLAAAGPTILIINSKQHE